MLELNYHSKEKEKVRKRSKEAVVIHLRSTFHAGGTENLIVRFFNTPVAGFRILLVLMKPGPLMHDLQASKNKVVSLYRRHKVDFRFLNKLIKLIREEQPTCIHTHQEIELFYAALVKVFFPKLKIYHQIHLYNPKSNYEYYLEKYLVKHWVHQLLVVSHSLQAQLLDRGYDASKMVILPNIVQVTTRLSLVEKNEFLQAINFQQGEQIIGMIGNFVTEKDQLTLAQAFRLIMNEFPKTKLVLIGKESPKTLECKEVFLPEELNQRVFFLGQVNNASELIPFFSLMVFSSRQETFGMAAIEALLYKVPMIASDIPVMKELSDNNRYFELFSTGDSADLATKIRLHLLYPTPDEQLTNSAEYAQTAFNAENFVQKLAQLYNA